MARVRRYLDIDVLTAARQRMGHIYDTFDSVVVCFSGGKDSLVTLHLAKEAAEARGIERVDCLFRDEELIPNAVVDFVEEYRQKPWLKMLYFAVPLRSNKFIMGKSFEYVQWDPNRKHIRPIPPHAITLPPGDTRVFDQYSMDALAAGYYKGRIAFVTGVRAAESIIRYQATMRKLNESYIVGSDVPSVKLCKPIYDWSEDDVFKFFMDQSIRYCPIYDAQHLSAGKLRVATPLHSENAKRIGILRAQDPAFYQGVMDLFPEMLVQERYWAEFDQNAVVEEYGQEGIAGVRRYIEEKIEDEAQRNRALIALADAEVRHRSYPESYPLHHVLKYIVGGSFKRSLMPINRKKEPANG